MQSAYDLGNTMLLKDRVYHALKNEIILGNLKAGQQLNMLDLSSQMNISNAPLREALNMLSKDGLVTLNPRKQAIVAEVSYEEKNIIVFLRSTLEPYAARLSVQSIPQKRIDEVRKELLAFLDQPYDAMRYITSDLNLHELLHQYAGSKILSEVISSVKEYSIRLRYSVERFDKDDVEAQKKIATISTKEHLAILEAIESRDGDLVYERVCSHILNFSDRVDNIRD